MLKPDGSHDEDHKSRLVCWMGPKGSCTIVFSHYIETEISKQPLLVIKPEKAREKLVHLIKEENRPER
ncbi:hypothetical protein [Candidatus Midichloria mitochondrii]|nr:hypothetical protein [Candidatus Midichloria mitochondrii]MDJ1255957.1 hypothetical protein [Candidatus Midichloria mitochondrii]